MGRLDWESGRFTADYETNQMQSVLRGWQSEFGDSVLWYRYWMEQSQEHDIFDEATAAGRLYHPPAEVPMLHATHVEGGAEDRREGWYYNDDFYGTASFDQLTKIGMTELDLAHQSYIRDRIVYDYRVFRVVRISVTGQIQKRDIMVSVEGTEVKPDEMVNDPQFRMFAKRRVI